MSFKAVATITFVAEAETISATNAIVAYISSFSPFIAELAFSLLEA
jgi:hypothetical protein